MATFGGTQKRNVIPRWRSIEHANLTNELKPLKSSSKLLKKFDLGSVTNSLDAWKKYHTLYAATDLISNAYILGLYGHFSDAAEYILSNENSSYYARKIASIIIGKNKSRGNQFEARLLTNNDNDIHETRQRLTANPHNVLLWLELARQYTVLGHFRKAKEAIHKTLAFESNNRFILRSIARFFIHIKEPDVAQNLLFKNSRTLYDPWLLSTEIATNTVMEKSSRLLRKASKMLTSKDYSLFDLNELYSAMGTHEYMFGSYKKAKKLLKQSILQPTENTFAQYIWFLEDNKINTGEKHDKFPNYSFEAMARDFKDKAKYDEAIKQIICWLSDQPFSKHPTILGSYIYSVAYNDFKKGAELSIKGLISNPNDNLLLNNAAFDLASYNNIVKAEEYFNKIDLSSLFDSEKIVVTATTGLLNFRNNKIEIGRQLYNKAIKEALQNGFKELATRAAIYLLREEIVANTEFIENSIKRALDLYQKFGKSDNDSRILILNIEKYYLKRKLI